MTERTRYCIQIQFNKVVEALRPFAAIAKELDRINHEDDSTCTWRLSAKDIRLARDVLAALDKEISNGKVRGDFGKDR